MSAPLQNTRSARARGEGLSRGDRLRHRVASPRDEFVELAYEYPGDLPPPDSEHYFKHPLRVAREMGLRTAVYSMRTPDLHARHETMDGAEVYRFDGTLRLLAAASRAQPRLSHGHTFGWIPSTLAAFTLKPYVFTPHVYRLDSYTPLVSGPLARAVGRSEALVVLTHHEAAQFEPYAAGRIHVIPHPIDVGYFSVKDTEGAARIRDSLGADPLVATVANLMPKKNLEVLIVAFSRVRADHPHAKLAIAGGVARSIMGIGRSRRNRGTYLDRLKALARELGVADSVFFLGHQDPEGVRALYSAADVYALPSLGECQSLTTGEAAASGLPLVVSDIPSFREQYGDAALYFDPADARALAESLGRMLSDRTLARSCVEKAKARIQGYDLAQVLPKLRALYEQCLAAS